MVRSRPGHNMEKQRGNKQHIHIQRACCTLHGVLIAYLKDATLWKWNTFLLSSPLCSAPLVPFSLTSSPQGSSSVVSSALLHSSVLSFPAYVCHFCVFSLVCLPACLFSPLCAGASD